MPTHDGEYHIVRFWQFDKVFSTGNLLPRWAPDLDRGRGVPIFAFFYPLPNYIAEVFVLLGFSYVKSLHLVLASGLILSGITFHLWMTTLFKPWASAVGAVFYILAPYHLVDVFIRGSVGEMWSLALAPLVLFFTTKLISRLKSDARACEVNRIIVLNSIIVFLLLLSHNILGPVFFAFGLIYGVVVVYQARAHKIMTGLQTKAELKYVLFKNLLLSFGLGFMLSGFFWVPVVFDQQYVEGLNIVDVTSHFPQLYQLLVPSWGTGFSGVGNLGDQMSFQIGVPHLLAVLLILTLKAKSAYLQSYKKSDFSYVSYVSYDSFLAVFMLTVFAGAVVLMLSVSEPIWRIVPFMQYFQHPWRLLSLVILTSSFLVAAVSSIKSKILVPFMLILAFVFYLPYTKPVVYPARDDSFYLENPTWTEGTATLGDSFRARKGAKEKIDSSNARKIGNLISFIGLL
ncbi:MAG: hypothetical protein ACE5GL_05870, partial [Calditrichia bacterium]